MTTPLRILTVIGARPQIIKAAAISRAIANYPKGRVVETLLHTGQHYDANMSQVFFEELGIPDADINLNVGSGNHGAMTARMIDGVEQVLLKKEHDLVLLYGDTNSTLAGALAAVKLNVPIAHVEAGLRSFNKRMPEEVNRIACDHMSTWLFCPTATAVNNLDREGFPRSIGARPSIDHPLVDLSGDVMFDNSTWFAGLSDRRSSLMSELRLISGGFILATVHREINTDDPVRLNAIFRSLLALHQRHDLPFVLPVHPRTLKCMDSMLDAEVLSTLRSEPSFHLLPPVGFLDMIALEKHARMVVTDSGGVQKEAFFFNTPCIVLRTETEWIELVQVGQAILVDADEKLFAEAAQHFLEHGAPTCSPIFGDGHAAERIVERLVSDLG